MPLRRLRLPEETRTRALPPDHQPLSALERSILLTALYADLFDYPLTKDELYGQLVGVPADEAAFARALDALLGRYLTATRGYVVWRGREDLVPVRRRRQQIAGSLWETAGRYARWLAKVPFVRMVAVSGSLAVENSEDHGDIDLFCITEAKRLWLARLCIVPLSKLTHLFRAAFPRYLCPNYILALDALEVPDRNLFTAHEVTKAVPLWGAEVHRRFLKANAWVSAFLPHHYAEHRLHQLDERPRPWLTRQCEGLLRGRAGDALDRWAHRLFVAFYRKRAQRRGWSWKQLEHAYQPNRYTVPEGGYVRVIHRLFVHRVRERLGPQIPDADLDRLFAFPDDGTLASCYDWEALFAQEYGVSPSNGAQHNGNAGTPPDASSATGHSPSVEKPS